METELQREIRERLINIELKVNALVEAGGVGASSDEYAGHADQAFGHITYAQHGEDLIIANALHALGVARPTYVDVGAHHPLNVSNTALLHKRGNHGINIDANPNLIAAFRKLRPNDVNLNVGVGPKAGWMDFYFIDDFSGRNSFDKRAAEEFVRQHPEFSVRYVRKIEVRTLDEIIEEHAKGVWPDFMSIDVEGLDYSIIESSRLDSRWGPRLLCCEVVSSLSDDASGDVIKLLASRGYRPFARTIGNVVFARADAYDTLRLDRPQ